MTALSARPPARGDREETVIAHLGVEELGGVGEIGLIDVVPDRPPGTAGEMRCGTACNFDPC